MAWETMKTCAEKRLKSKYTPLAEYRLISVLALFCSLATFVLLLLVALSLPIIKPVYLVKVTSSYTNSSSEAATELRFGVWGVCGYSIYDEPSLYSDEGGDCYGPKLGYSVPSYISEDIGIDDDITKYVLDGLFIVLVLHPVAAGLAFISLLASLFLASHAVAIVALLLTTISALLTTLVMATDIAIVLLVRKGIAAELTSFSLSVSFGNAVWMVVVSAVIKWIAVVLFSARSCYCCGVQR
ncbi:hypothetical protein FISHEDRAFT_75905 [Fistulina hepatica ATCC 64428]|uniref:Pali-domain-containing protein n=1 Tax=Fistulina hepatica ATCC 64428 TaxID=1128425 RepID=A0A0D7A6Q4_9AGAR|nr:hypothetical protein FISHEDRAFT_75905 [Fistulina hepatica ATCC 64428]